MSHFRIKTLRLAFRLLYNELAWIYDVVSWFVSLGRWRKWQRQGIPYLKGTHILELAHGTGHMLIELNQTGTEVVGLDFSPNMVKIARRRLDRAGVDIPIIRGRSQSLPFADETFDSVLSTFPAEFIIEKTSLSSLFRIIKFGGRVVLVPEARLTGGGVIQRFIDLLTGQGRGPVKENGPSIIWSNASDRITHAGFNVSIRKVVNEGDEVIVIIADKPLKGG